MGAGKSAVETATSLNLEIDLTQKAILSGLKEEPLNLFMEKEIIYAL